MTAAAIAAAALSRPQRPRLVDVLWAAQGGLCFHCRKPMVREGGCQDGQRWSREHLFPRVMYGTGPIVLAHCACNNARGDRAPLDWEISRARALYVAAELPWQTPQPLPVSYGFRPLGNMGDLWPAGAA